ncbi:MAG: phenylalanine--tRNA ligase subunit alpha [Fusobacterium varium]|jgi:phenylalanyl-tRNA synthetase alpha chain|uniref:Phenylalanine--tRNA ligase alpha subunit n=1 Tax=Fusobacterium varium ATCC 27725 TaxID=469618 RepID=A0ABM6U2P9_FUSVA|nr:MULTISPECIES: phenylalanine--tRNA ligase subunit alpha [Fusobacterium]AVQ30563.1 phenylalanine--tRNA ligase subunit alpha [Fusobacterium varium ATCC 27725]EES63999.1 phenylalanine--tRNA ligase, alpha subunit [Fusobacterium varium ATCC 27725]MCD7979977.1 phenylalanine--tRNA ligase subunit alpha [Fusobacterium sp.]MCF2672794.1 phenylalanine--tRNA ligase subunit alpha [Fusobacterium varium]MCI6032719.1 phenylalanine--tRNA ligase subunit alpha [Fusobacterium varium]
MKEKVAQLKEQAQSSIESAASLHELEEIRVSLLGKKGELTEISKGMKTLSPEERPIIGQLVNETREFISSMLDEKNNQLKEKEKRARLEQEIIDITLPGEDIELGTSHPITETMNFMKDIFIEMGFDVADGPEVEKVKYNFDALNIPETHPSRDITDTFYISDDVVLRTQTSPVQVRYMLEHKPPFRMICPGKVYRPDYDVSHTPMFHQMEGLMIGENISFANLKGILTHFVKKVFGETEVRFRPHFFPFTEPSAEMDVQCAVCKGKGCRVCKDSGWLEIMGCGMVDPEVLKAVGYDPNEVSGFAFGVGIERVTMLRHGIDDLRAFFENDIRFLKQFK